MGKTQVPMDDPKSVQRMFEAAVKVMRSLPEDGAYELSDDMLAIFYSYYKQATVGPCNTLKPNSWDPIGKVKWEAWKALGNISKYQAMREYVQEIQLIIETLPVTDRMAELMDALDPFYEIVEDEDEAARSKPAQLSTGGTNGDKEGDADETGEEDESDSSVVNIEDDADLMEANKDLNILAAREGGSLVFNGSEESSVSSSTNETHSSLNTEVQEEELMYCREPPNFGSSDWYPRDESDDELYSDLMEKPEKTQKGSGVPRVRLADVSAVGANIKQRQGGNREAQCVNQDGKPQGVTPPVPHPPALGTVQTDRMSQSRGRGCRVVETNLTEHSCQGDGEMKGRKDKQAFNMQIAMTLSQLQNNMQNVLQRLTTLEILTASQIESIPLESCRTNIPNTRLPWWPLDLSPISVVLAVMWPFAVHWLVQVYLLKRKRWLKYNPVK